MIVSVSILGIRLMGIYFLFNVLLSGTSFLVTWLSQGTGGQSESDPYTGLFLGTFFALSVFILAFSGRIGGLVAKGLEEADGPVGAQGVVAIGAFLIGLYWTVSQLPTALVRTVHAIADPSAYPQGVYADTILTEWVAALAAILIMARSGWVGEVFSRLRAK